MKIFIVCSCLTGGGAERVGVMLANGFARKGYDVSIVTDTNKRATFAVDGNIRILPLNPNTSNKLNKWIGAIALVRKHAKKYRPDVIIGIMQLCSMVSKLGCIGLNVPIVMTEHYAFEFVKSESFGIMRKCWVRYLFDRFYPCVTVLTEADRKVIGNNLKNVVVMPNPLTFESVKDVPAKEQYLFAAGRISDWHYKGFDLLIEAWGKFSSKYPEWVLKIAGNGSQEDLEFLKEKANEHGVIERIEFLGYRTDMQNLYQKAAIYVLSSRSEGLPMVLLEAMSQGCACVATDFKGRTKEIITNDREGILCNTEDINALAQCMEKLIVNEEYRNSLQQNAINRSEYFSLNNIICMWEKLIFNLIHK